MSSLKQRSHPRCACRIPITITLEGNQLLEVTSVNIGLGGLQVEHPGLPFAAVVSMRFRLPSLDEDSLVEGTVRWVKGGIAGIQFGSLRARDVWGINQLLRTVAA